MSEDAPPTPETTTPVETKAPKPGWKSTEFWMTVGFHLSAILLVVFGWFDAGWAITATAAVQYIYTYTRGKVKEQDAKTETMKATEATEATVSKIVSPKPIPNIDYTNN